MPSFQKSLIVEQFQGNYLKLPNLEFQGIYGVMRRMRNISLTVWKINFFLHFSLVSVQVEHNIAVVRTHWWLRSYSSQALERYKLKAECLFLICLGLLFALNCSFWYTKVARCLDGL